jgi:hypothetical protein
VRAPSRSQVFCFDGKALLHRCFVKKVQAAIETSKAGHLRTCTVQSTRHSSLACTFSLLKSLTHQRSWEKSRISPALRTLSVPRPFNLCHCDLQLYSTGLKATARADRSLYWLVTTADRSNHRKSLKFWLGFERFENRESFGPFGEERKQKKDGEWRCRLRVKRAIGSWVCSPDTKGSGSSYGVWICFAVRLSLLCTGVTGWLRCSCAAGLGSPCLAAWGSAQLGWR